MRARGLIRRLLLVGGSSRRLRLMHAGWLCLGAAIALSLVGFVGIDLALNPQPEGPLDLAPLAWKQVVFALVGLGCAVVAAWPSARAWAVLCVPIAIATILLLAFLLVPGVPSSLVAPINGARAWITLPGFSLQPSEPAKVAYVLVMARLLRQPHAARGFSALVVPALVTLVPVAIILLQPDLGTASLFAPSLVAMVVVAGARLRHLAIIAAVALMLAPAAWPLLRPHQKARFAALVQQVQGDRSRENDINFQSFTAQRLIGSGGLAGQSDARARALVRFNRLPEAHNDMVFSVLAARFGLVGSLALLALFLAWFAGAILAAAWCKDPFGRALCVGLSAFVVAQVVVNVGMNIGLLPIIGVTLPFVSYGGSSMLTCWIMTGLVFGTAMRRDQPAFLKGREYAPGHGAPIPDRTIHLA